ncbi:MAG: hypothetical protein K2N38_01765 [Oscillospiraceae bacterium]|nr:hypothetical protein [Oscillospiraceae bacterium]
MDNNAQNDPDDGFEEIVIDLPNGETTTLCVYHLKPTDYDPEEEERLRDEWWDKIEEQKAKYGDMLPLEYEDWMPEGRYGIMSDMGYMISYATYWNTADDAKRKEDIYIDYDGNRHISIDSLNTEDAEIVFEDGTPASEDDLTPGTAMLVQYDRAQESYPGHIYCTKIIILQ